MVLDGEHLADKVTARGVLHFQVTGGSVFYLFMFRVCI